MYFAEHGRVYLREVNLADSSKIVCWKGDLLMRRMSIGLTTEVTLMNQDEDIRRSLKAKDELYTIICLKGTNQAIGYIRINWMDTDQTMAWLRFGLGEQRGKGFATEAIIALINNLFNKGMVRMEAEVYAYNHKSLRLLDKLGFQREGLKRSAHYEEGTYHDVICFGLLKSDWDKRWNL